MTCAIVGLLAGLAGVAQWFPVTSGTTQGLHSIWFDNALTGYCGGGGDMWGWPVDTGLVLRTDDAGLSWYPVYEAPGIAINEVVAFNDTVICSATRVSAYVRLSSFDGGITWVEDTLPYHMFGMTEEQGTVRYMEWTFGGLHEIHNGLEDTWYLGAPMAYHVTGDSYTVLAELPGEHIAVFFSDDLNESWVQRPIDLPTAVYAGSPSAIYRNGDTIIVRNTDKASTLVSLDEGLSWTPHYEGPYSDTWFHSATNIHGTAMGGSIQHSGDLGADWSVQHTDTTKLFGIHFVDNQAGYVCGENGTILKTGNGGGVGILEPGTLGSLAVFPNPTDGEVSIVIPDHWKVTAIDLLDGMGVLVHRAALQQRRLDLSKLPAGPYVLRIAHDGAIGVVRVFKP